MALKSVELRKRRKAIRRSMNDQLSKQTEKRLLIELKAKLEVELAENDRVMLEVEPRVTGEFLNILEDEILSMYDFEQIDSNKYIFYNKSFDI